jgi:hypothetical protein
VFRATCPGGLVVTPSYWHASVMVFGVIEKQPPIVTDQ